MPCDAGEAASDRDTFPARAVSGTLLGCQKIRAEPMAERTISKMKGVFFFIPQQQWSSFLSRDLCTCSSADFTASSCVVPCRRKVTIVRSTSDRTPEKRATPRSPRITDTTVRNPPRTTMSRANQARFSRRRSYAAATLDMMPVTLMPIRTASGIGSVAIPIQNKTRRIIQVSETATQTAQRFHGRIFVTCGFTNVTIRNMTGMEMRGRRISIGLSEEDENDGSESNHESADEKFDTGRLRLFEILQLLRRLMVGGKEKKDEERRDEDEVVPEHPEGALRRRTLRREHADDGDVDAARAGKGAQSDEESSDEGCRQGRLVHPFLKSGFGVEGNTEPDLERGKDDSQKLDDSKSDDEVRADFCHKVRCARDDDGLGDAKTDKEISKVDGSDVDKSHLPNFCARFFQGEQKSNEERSEEHT